MEASQELLVISELAIGLAGFSGVVAAFARQDGGLRGIERYFFICLITVALSTVILAFVPFIWQRSGIVGASIWQGASATMLAIALFETVFLTMAAPVPSGASPLGFVPEMVARGLPLLIVLSQVGNIFGWPIAPGPQLYIIGLLIWLLLAALTFVYLVLHGIDEDEDPAQQ